VTPDQAILVPRIEANGLVESTNTKVRLLTRMAFGFKSREAMIALAMLNLGGYCPPLPGRRAAA
jgi:transposase